MNKTEQAYGDLLEQRKQVGEVVWYKFEGVKLRLAAKDGNYPRWEAAEREIKNYETILKRWSVNG